MKDPYKEVFEEIGKVLNSHTDMIMELAKACLTIKQYEEFAKTIDERIAKKKEAKDEIKSWTEDWPGRPEI